MPSGAYMGLYVISAGLLISDLQFMKSVLKVWPRKVTAVLMQNLLSTNECRKDS